jgi:hypothetical protein
LAANSRTEQQLRNIRITEKNVILQMEKSIDPRLELSLPMLRDLVNTLAVISGHCDLFGDG